MSNEQLAISNESQTRQMKDSGVEWIGEIPAQWKVTKLLNILRSSISDGPHETPELVSENGIPFISVDSLNSTKSIDFSVVKKYISEEKYSDYCKKTKLEKGDILFSKSASIGKTAIVGNEKFMIWSPLAIIKVDAQNVVDFVYYLLNCEELIKYVSLMGSYNTQFNVGMRTLERVPVPIPKANVQQTIAAYLDRKCTQIDTLIANQQQQIEKLKAYKQSVITETVTKGLDPDVAMKDSGVEWIGEIPEHWDTIRIKQLLRERKERSVNGEEEPLSMSQKLGLVPTKMLDIVPNMATSFVGAKLAYIDDLVFNKLKAHLGVFSVSKYDGLVSPDYAVYFSTGLCNLKYLEYLFKTPQCISEFRKRSTGIAAGLTRLYTDGLFAIECPLPSKEEQQQIAEYLDQKCEQIDRLIAIKQQKIEKLQQYKKSLIYEYVTGKKEVI